MIESQALLNFSISLTTSEPKNVVPSSRVVFDEYNKKKAQLSFGKLLYKSLVHMFGIKISDSDLDIVAKSNNPAELGNMMEQSPLIEPNARKRRRNTIRRK